MTNCICLSIGFENGTQEEEFLRKNSMVRCENKIANGEKPSLSGKAAVIGWRQQRFGHGPLPAPPGRLPCDRLSQKNRRYARIPGEIEAALEEGVEIMELFAPVRYEKKGDRLALTLQKMRIADEFITDVAARSRSKNETVQLKAVRVVTAIGGEPEARWMPPADDGGKRLHFPHCTVLDAGIPAAFGGDLTNPVKSVTDAIASGKAAAIAFDAIFRGGMEIRRSKSSMHAGSAPGPALSMEMYLGGGRERRSSDFVSFYDINIDYFEKTERSRPRSIAVRDGDNPFAESSRLSFPTPHSRKPPDASTAASATTAPSIPDRQPGATGHGMDTVLLRGRPRKFLDTTLMAFKLAESVNLPVMVVLDAFFLSHTFEPADILDQQTVR